MTKIRVYELAKEIGMESKELINRFGTMGVSLKNHMSAIDNEDAQKMREKLMPPKERAKLMQERGEKEPPAKPPERPSVQQPVNRNADREQTRPQGQQQRTAGQNQGQGQQPRSAGTNQGQGYQPRPAGQNQGQGQQPRPAGENQGQGYRPRPAGQNQGQGQQPRPTGQNQGQGYQPRPAGQNQGQGYQPRPAGQNQGQGYQSRPAGQNQGQGYQSRPAGQNQGQGYQSRPAGQNQGQGYQSRPAGQNQGQGQQPRPAGQNQGQGQRPRPAGPNQGPQARANGSGAGAKPGVRGTQQGKPKTAARPFSLEKPVRKPKHKKPKHAKPEVDNAVAVNSGDEEIQVITIAGTIAVQDLAEKMQKNPSELIKKLMGLGVMATINQEIDSDTASILAAEFNYEIQIEAPEVEEAVFEEPEDKPEDMLARPCVVTVMGHVDHGKTSLLDAIREANVIASEAGGITQHIGAYQVDHNGKKITFLDTPGHEAFTAMRARGAQATDIAILVVAADDGVMPQTVEAINHSKAAGVPIIVAINKMDKPGANPDRVKQELTEYNLLAEDWGGDTICVNVSAKSREGIETLLEMILLVAEMGELKANPDRLAKGTVIEAELDKGRGPVATVLVQTGTLNIGDAIVAGMAFGKVRAMVDDKGRRVKKALPSTPVEVLGLSDVPQAGDIFMAAPDEKTARLIATKRVNKKREEEQKAKGKISLEDLFDQIKEGQVKELNIIIKADVQGSIEALRQSLAKLSTDEVRVNAIHGGVGAITETDIMLASASNAIIIGFNIRPDVNARKAAENEKVDVRLYRVIYNAIEDVKAAMSGLLEPEFKEVILGRVEVRQIFKATKFGTIAGCYVLEGKISRNAELRVIRDGVVVHEGKLDSLKRFKDDAKDVAQGYECGVTIDNFNDIQEGDIIEPFIYEEIKRQL